MKEIVTDNFTSAVRDYFSLLDKRYPIKRTLELVGDRYSLSKHQRVLLYRGVTNGAAASARRRKLTSSISGSQLSVDTYNVLLTIVNYLYGRVVFLGNDGFLRDAGEVFGSVLMDDTFYKGVDLFLGYLSASRIDSCTLYIDSPVSFSGKFAAELRQELLDREIPGTAETVHSPDYLLKNETGTIIATSDSVIIDGTAASVFDLARMVLDDTFQPDYIDLSLYI
jgi:hypothetical protein